MKGFDPLLEDRIHLGEAVLEELVEAPELVVGRQRGDVVIGRAERSETVVDGKWSVTTNCRHAIRRVITADEIATRLGPRDDHIRVLMLGQGNEALELRVPFVTLPVLRPGHVPADWERRELGRVEPAAQQTARILTLPTLSKGTADRIRDLGE